jgi:hypothetical protein
LRILAILRTYVGRELRGTIYILSLVVTGRYISLPTGTPLRELKVGRGQKESSRGSEHKKKAMDLLHGFFVRVDSPLSGARKAVRKILEEETSCNR